MAKSEHQDLSRKEMKGPDWFQAKAVDAASWATRNQKGIVVALGGALAVVAVALGISAWMTEREATAGALLYRTLEAVDGEISSVPLPGLGRKVFATAEERDRAIVAAAAEAIQAYPSSAAARTAALAAGDAHLRLGKWDAALESYQRFLSGPAQDSLPGRSFRRDSKQYRTIRKSLQGIRQGRHTLYPVFYTRVEVFIADGHWRCRGQKEIEYPGGQPR